MGYIRFLHEQVQVLCSPYLQQFPSSPEPPLDYVAVGAAVDGDLYCLDCSHSCIQVAHMPNGG
ncbi:hypothetical protein CRG98_007989 [Punica granatum]|uniref:Uncharacterized protein n=1 Tax=Punica granatum TaxID=22663 RepID=A0A2I0KUY6_PUNGR|nr:hypothetical protein CRG98_007989 [Punica granatum]